MHVFVIGFARVKVADSATPGQNTVFHGPLAWLARVCLPIAEVSLLATKQGNETVLARSFVGCLWTNLVRWQLFDFDGFKLNRRAIVPHLECDAPAGNALLFLVLRGHQAID